MSLRKISLVDLNESLPKDEQRDEQFEELSVQVIREKNMLNATSL